jgi:ribosome biogenesis GTPase A
MSKPIKAARNKGIDVAMWQTRNGGYSFSFRKSYKDKQTGEYKEAKQFFPEELDILISLLQEARSWTAQGPTDGEVKNAIDAVVNKTVDEMFDKFNF